MILIRKCVEENACDALNQDKYQNQFIALVELYEIAKNRLDEIADEK